MGRVLVNLHVVQGSQMIDKSSGDDMKADETLRMAVDAVGIRVRPAIAPPPAVGNGVPFFGAVSDRRQAR